MSATDEATAVPPPVAIAKPAVATTKCEHALETILLVEDETNLRRLVHQYLEQQGYTVLEAAEGAAAIEVSNSHLGPIHLLLTDVILPGMNGRELAHTSLKLRPETRVLYMSGYSENAIAHDGILEEGITLLQKPFTLPALKAKVREKLSRLSRAQRFNLNLPLKYRLVGEGNWRKGTTENISRSGMLFRAEEMVSPMPCSRLASCYRWKLQVCRQPKSSAVARLSEPWNPSNPGCARLWQRRFCSITSSTGRSKRKDK